MRFFYRAILALLPLVCALDARAVPIGIAPTEVSGSGGHVIKNEGSSLPTRAGLNFVGAGVDCSTDATNVICTIPGTGGSGNDLVVNNSPQFVGRVSCVDGGGVVDGATHCVANLTAFGGQVFTNGSYITVRGTYVAATPQTVTNGFKLSDAYFPNSCNGSTLECGDDFKAFAAQLETLSDVYMPPIGGPAGVVSGKPVLHFLTAEYKVDPRAPIYLHSIGWALDFCSGPVIFHDSLKSDNAVTPVTGTVAVNVSTDPRWATISGGTLCGGGTCFDGDEIARPGDRVKFGAGGWDTTGIVGVIIGMNSTGTAFQFTPPLASNFSGSIEIGGAKIVELDRQSRQFGNAAQGFYGSVEMMCPGNARVLCDGNCLNANPYGPSPRPNTIYRTVPLQAVVQHSHPSLVNRMSIVTPCGRNDSSLTVTSPNVLYETNAAGSFEGDMSGCGAYSEMLTQITGNDPNTNADDGVGALVTVLAPGFSFKPRQTIGGVGRAFLIGGNDSIGRYDTHVFENVMQLAWLPDGGQNIEFDGLSQEQMVCGPALGTTCEDLAARRPFLDIAPWTSGDPNDFASYSFRWSKAFQYQRSSTWIRVNDTHPVRLTLNGAIKDTSKLLDITGSRVNVVGNVQCDVGFSGVSTACDLPVGQGIFTDFIVQNYDGTVHANGRLLSDLSGFLPLAKFTDDNVNTNRCLLSGGSGGNPTWGICPGGGATALSQLTDVLINVTPEDQGPLAWDQSLSRWTPHSVTWFRDNSTNVLYMHDWPTHDLLVGGPSVAVASIFLGHTGAVVLNEQGNNVVIRMEGDTDPNLFYLNGATDRLGIGTNSPSVKLDVNGQIRSRSIACNTQVVNTDANGVLGCTVVGPTQFDQTATAHYAFAGYQDIAEISAPANPGAGFQRVYGKAGSGLCSRSSAGVEYCPGTGGGSGTVTSVALSLPAIFTVSGSPVTTSGTLTGTLATQSANLFFSGPSSGGAAAPTFRGMVLADIPDSLITSAKVLDGTLVNADINASAAIAGTKISPDFGAQNIVTTGTLTAANFLSSCSGTGDCFGIAPPNSVDIQEPAAGAANFGMFSGTFSYRLNGEAVSSKILRPYDFDQAANQILLGGGTDTLPVVLGSLGTTTTVLHGNASGAPSFGAVSLSADVTGNLPPGNLNSGTNADATHFWRGDGVWAVPAGGGTVTSVALSVPGSSILGVTGSPITNSGTLGLTTTGTSGGILYFSSGSVLSSSAALTANTLVLGGGAGVAPSSLGAGTTTTLLHGNASGAPTFSAVSLTADVTGTLGVANGGTGLTSGTSGGIPGYTATGTLTSSALLTANALMLGGGAGATPTVLASLGSTTAVLHGNASGPPSFGQIVAGDVTNDTLTATQFAATLTFADGDFLDLSAINASSTTEGLKLPQASSTTSSTAEGQLAWNTTNHYLTVGNGTTAVPQIPEFAWLANMRVNATATAGNCINIAGPAASGASGGSCNSAATNFFATRNMTITALSFVIRTGATTPATTNGCDLGISINGTTQGTDTDFLDWGGTVLDAPGDFQTSTVSYSVTAGDRVELIWVAADAAQCPSGSGCSCAGIADGLASIWARAR